MGAHVDRPATAGDVDKARVRLRTARHAAVTYGYSVVARRAGAALGRLDADEVGSSSGRRAVGARPDGGERRAPIGPAPS